MGDKEKGVFTPDQIELSKLEKHLSDPETNRDLFGVVRGHCLQARTVQQ
jgi:hypothetical protein